MQIQLGQKTSFKSTSPTSLMHRKDYSALMDFSGNIKFNHFALLQVVVVEGKLKYQKDEKYKVNNFIIKL